MVRRIVRKKTKKPVTKTRVKKTNRRSSAEAPVAKRLRVDILPQPNDTTCGPTCLHAVYRYFGDHMSLKKLIPEVTMLASGGTLAVYLACHALDQGYSASIYTYNLHIFDPSWFRPNSPPLANRLKKQMAAKPTPQLQIATLAYLDFLQRGGKILFEDLRPALIKRYVSRGIPILTGLSATYLYRTAREIGDTNEPDDVFGEPSGHFVVLCGYDALRGSILVADPYGSNPVAKGQYYEVTMDRLIASILLGIVTNDANLLIIEPR